MEILSADIMTFMASYIWPFARLSGMVMVMIVSGAKTTPPMIRLFYCLALTVMVAPVLPPMPNVELFSLGSFMIILQQSLIGIAIGFVTVMLIQTFVIAGQIIAMQTSLGFAAMADPASGQTSPVIGQIYILLGTLVYLSVNGHLFMIETVVKSFETLPVSASGLMAVQYYEIAGWMSVMIAAALSMSLSAVVAMLVINFSFGVMTKAAPQLNVFSLGFAVGMVAGLFIIYLSLKSFMFHFNAQWQRAGELICSLLNNACAY
ncbi:MULTISPECIES: flagellar biosynthetic protein FliR [unclassified Moritella]|uniref:flagellar biosynthetic protein FliR n=1 Tax=unclassified Moritella TaxID=2637987 RepID=UPI001BAA857A|nr:MULTISPECIES: flagellar biosynthetic protein FliR [unclassified Moritella]QUM83978.1 flagellar type III secretion system protein FliR [Moritella sp. 28]QUM88285.1 flagellar type III secretion system protein FliR [Moritella sp. 36]